MEIKQRKNADFIIFDIYGNFLEAEPNITELHERIKELIDKGKSNFLINIENIDKVDAFGVGEILACFILMKRHECKFGYFPVKHLPKLGIPVYDPYTYPPPGVWSFLDEEDAIKNLSK